MTPRAWASRASVVAVVLVAVALAFLISAQAAPGQPARTSHWVGNITFRQLMTWAGSEGETTTTFNLQVRWRERERIDVVDANGAVVGQIAVLVDDGSSWLGSLEGTTTRRDTCSVTVTNYEGSGRGDSTIFTAWVYFSMADDDPLAQRVPNGTYFVVGDSRQQFTGTMTAHTENVCPAPGSYVFDTEFPAGALGVQIGRAPISWPNEIPQEQVPADAILQAYERADAMGLGDMPLAASDPQPRQLQDGNAMVGRFNTDPGAGLRWEADWDIRRATEVRVVLDEVDADWVPRGGPQANTLTMSARIEEEELEGRFRFRLAELSQEPGFAMNAGTETGKDLEFAPDQEGFEAPQETDDGWTIEGTEAVNEARIEVRALDYGAFGRLSCEVIIDGEWHACETSGGDAFTTIPLDENRNTIADSWERDKAVFGQSAAADDDAEPDGTQEHGDGLTNYEEYRGFMANGVHYRTEPGTKNLFLHDADGLARATWAIQIFDVLYVDESELGDTSDPTLINFNQCEGDNKAHHRVEQHGVRVVSRPSPATLDWGCAYPCVARVIGPPKTCEYAAIYASQIRADLKTEFDGFYADLDADAVISYVTDHEIGHCIGAYHHRPDKFSGDPCVMRYFHKELFAKTFTEADLVMSFCASESRPQLDLSDPS